MPVADNKPIEIRNPSLKLSMTSYVNRLLNYRYHWHEDQYEINIILCGRAVFNIGGSSYEVEKDDVVIIDPLVGHASLSLEADAQALVIRFDAAVYPRLLGEDCQISFSHIVSGADERNEDRFRTVRGISADLTLAAYEGGSLAAMKARSSAELLVLSLLSLFPYRKEGMRRGAKGEGSDAGKIRDFLEKSYMERKSLQDLADYTGYNRTYLSTFLKEHTGLNFHELLTRIRFQHAFSDLTYTQKNLGQIAADNGFPSVKAFSSFFSENFHMSPLEYRGHVSGARKAESYFSRILVSPTSGIAGRTLASYAKRGQ